MAGKRRSIVASLGAGAGAGFAGGAGFSAEIAGAGGCGARTTGAEAVRRSFTFSAGSAMGFWVSAGAGSFAPPAEVSVFWPPATHVGRTRVESPQGHR